MIEAKPIAVVIRLSALGDVLLTAPLVKALSKSHDVIFITSPLYKDLVECLDGVNRVEVLDKKQGRSGQKKLSLLLNKRDIDCVLDLQHKLRTMFLTRMIRAKTHLSLSKRNFKQALQALVGADFVLNEKHQVERYHTLLPEQPLPLQPVFFPKVPEAWTSRGAAFLNLDAERGAPKKVGFAFAATHATKGWSTDNIVKTILMHQDSVEWVMLGGPSDTEQLQALKAAGLPDSIRDTCKLSLETLTGVLSHLDLVVGIDTGPIHLARMVYTDTLVLFGPTSVNRWGPGLFASQHHRALSMELPCQPCSNHGGPVCPLKHHECMETLMPQHVSKVVEEMLEARS